MKLLMEISKAEYLSRKGGNFQQDEKMETKDENLRAHDHGKPDIFHYILNQWNNWGDHEKEKREKEAHTTEALLGLDGHITQFKLYPSS